MYAPAGQGRVGHVSKRANAGDSASRRLMFILKCQCPSIFPRPSHCTEDFSEVDLSPKP